MGKMINFVPQRRNYVTNNNITKNKAGIGASQNGVTSLFLHPRRLLFNLQNSDKMQRITHYVKWKPVDGFPEYSVSSNGMVKKNGRLLKIWKRAGAMYIYFTKKELGVVINRCYDLHRLVWESFGNTEKKKGYEIHHKDFDFTNNNIDNLVYIHKSEHLIAHGKRPSKSFVD